MVAIAAATPSSGLFALVASFVSAWIPRFDGSWVLVANDVKVWSESERKRKRVRKRVRKRRGAILTHFPAAEIKTARHSTRQTP